MAEVKSYLLLQPQAKQIIPISMGQRLSLGARREAVYDWDGMSKMPRLVIARQLLKD